MKTTYIKIGQNVLNIDYAPILRVTATEIVGYEPTPKTPWYKRKTKSELIPNLWGFRVYTPEKNDNFYF